MKPARDLREILARMSNGLSSPDDAKYMAELLDRLIWKEFMRNEYSVIRLCRHCNFPRGTPHANWCPAKGVDEEDGDDAED